jgi:hypothetical protein
MSGDEENDGENWNWNHRVIQHVIRLPQPIILGDNLQRSWEEWIIQYDFWASTQQLEQLPSKMQADSLMAILGPAVIKTFQSFKLNTEEKVNSSLNLTILTYKIKRMSFTKIKFCKWTAEFNKIEFNHKRTNWSVEK